MSASGQRRTIVSPALAIALVLVSTISLIAFFALSAYAPDFRNESNGDAHVLSKSAIGFAGLRVLLEPGGMTSTIDRGLGPRDAPVGMTVLTPEITSAPSEVKSRSTRRLSLIILPKWIPFQDPVRPGYVTKVAPIEKTLVAAALKDIAKNTTIQQAKGAAPVHLESKAIFEGLFVPSQAVRIDTLQTISGSDWIPIVTARNGGALLALKSGTAIFVLAEPYLMNNHGLADEATAAFALSFFTALSRHRAPVSFDVTLNGFGRSPDLLKAMFAPPFLGATICAILAAILIGFHAFTRFGATPPSMPGFALGKRALVDNTAELIRVMNREPQMAERYATATRNLISRALGIRRQMDRAQADAVLKALEQRAGESGIDALAEEAGRVRRRSELMRVAGQLFRWRERIMHAR
jgi:hypothetical protein